MARQVQVLREEGVELVEVSAQATKLESEGRRITCVISLRGFIVAGCQDGNVRVYDQDTTGPVRAVFTEHNDAIRCFEQLDDDLVVSVDRDGQMFTWRPSTTETIGTWKWPGEFVDRVAKLDENRLIVGTARRELALMSHKCGANLKMEMGSIPEHSSDIWSVLVSNNLVLSFSIYGAILRNKSTFNYLGKLKPKFYMHNIAVSDAHIVMVSMFGYIDVHRNAPPYALDFTLETSFSGLLSVVILNPDVVAVSDYSGCINFVSLSKKSLFARVKVSDYNIRGLEVLSDNRIVAVHKVGVCTLFYAPPQVQRAIYDYTTNKYGMLPILHAWNSVHQRSLTVLDACEAVIKTEYTTRSLDEWLVAHNLLTKTVKTGVIPRARDYKGTKLHWHRELYRHCDKMAIGQKDVEILISVFREAESAGVIAEGTSESFIFALHIHKDIDKDKWYTARTICHLFLRQVVTDVRFQQLFLKQIETDAHMKQFRVKQNEIEGDLEELRSRQNKTDTNLKQLSLKQIETDLPLKQLHSRQDKTEGQLKQLHSRQKKTDANMEGVLRFQKVQRRTSMVNAVLGFIPIVGSVATNAISGGAAIMNDFQVCGLVESLLGVGKEMTGGFGSDELVDRFLKRGNQVLSEDHWQDWKEENRQAVQEAARNIGLTVEELRNKLLLASEMMNNGQASTQCENGTKIVEIVEEKEADNRLELGTSSIQAIHAPPVVVPYPEMIRLKDKLLDHERVVCQEGNGSEICTAVDEKGTENPVDVEICATRSQDAPALVLPNAETSEQTVSADTARGELMRWVNQPLNEASIKKLKCYETASCLAAFLTNYDELHLESYIRLKGALQDVFSTQFIDGSLFVYADEGEREELIQAGMSAIATVVEGPASRNLGICLKQFLKKVLET